MRSSSNTTIRAGRLAMAAATVFLSQCVSAPSSTSDPAVETVACLGANKCSGQSQCKTAISVCAEHNNCKGQGWDFVTRAQCESVGGKEIPEPR